MSKAQNFGPALVSAILAVGLLFARPAAAMELTVQSAGLPLRVQLTGEINPGDAGRLIAQLKKAQPQALIAQLEAKAPSSTFDPRQWLWVDVESTGGDLEESLKLGRFLRSANTLITTRQTCASACVFLLAGAAERVGLAAAAGKIGIHRPSSMAIRAELTDYLAQMHVPTILADMMFATSPEETRVLTTDEIGIMFPARDPSWDEMTVARRASFYGLSSLSYRQVEAQAVQSCASAKGILAKNLSDVSDCMPARALPVMNDDFASGSLLFSGHCLQTPIMLVHRAGNADFGFCVQDRQVNVAAAQAVIGRS